MQWIFLRLCSFYHLGSRCFAITRQSQIRKLARSTAGNALYPGSDFRLNYNAIKGRCAQQSPMGQMQVAYTPARTDCAPCLSTVNGFKDVSGASTCSQDAVVLFIKLHGQDIGQAKRSNSLPGIACISAAKEPCPCAQPDRSE